MNGTPYMVEITRFDNALYQQQYDRTIAIYQIYRNYGLEIITIPVSTSRITMDAFFEERSQFWKVVERSEEHTSELQSRGHLVCRLLLEKKKNNRTTHK